MPLQILKLFTRWSAVAIVFAPINPSREMPGQNFDQATTTSFQTLPNSLTTDHSTI
jgi:hypothetical protein